MLWRILELYNLFFALETCKTMDSEWRGLCSKAGEELIGSKAVVREWPLWVRGKGSRLFRLLAPLPPTLQDRAGCLRHSGALTTHGCIHAWWGQDIFRLRCKHNSAKAQRPGFGIICHRAGACLQVSRFSHPGGSGKRRGWPCCFCKCAHLQRAGDGPPSLRSVPLFFPSQGYFLPWFFPIYSFSKHYLVLGAMRGQQRQK